MRLLVWVRVWGAVQTYAGRGVGARFANPAGRGMNTTDALALGGDGPGRCGERCPGLMAAGCDPGMGWTQTSLSFTTKGFHPEGRQFASIKRV